LSTEEHSIAHEMHRRRLLFYFYCVFDGDFNKDHLEALRDPLLHGHQMLVDRASRQWAGDPVTLKGALVRAVEYWEHLPDVEGIPSPVEFDQADLEKFAQTESLWLASNIDLERCYSRCGMTEEGWVLNEDYEPAKKELEQIKGEQ
jgi:hypothetical protein